MPDRVPPDAADLERQTEAAIQAFKDHAYGDCLEDCKRGGRGMCAKGLSLWQVWHDLRAELMALRHSA